MEQKENKVQLNIKLTPWVLASLRAHPEKNGPLIERLLIKEFENGKQKATD
jgi:hypothetical protein